MENLQVNLTPIGNEIIFREGAALPPVAPEKIKLTGNISAISDFLRVRKDAGYGLQSVDQSRAVVIVNKKDLTIRLLLDPENHYGAEVVAKLELSEELKQFGINTTQTFIREQLIKLIRFNKLYFANADKHEDLLKSYMAFDATANTTLQQQSDTRGNRGNNFQKQVSTNVPTEFILNIPIFKGEPSETFRVEICLDVTDGGARFWFESVELHELIKERTDTVFEYELEHCAGFVVINQ